MIRRIDEEHDRAWDAVFKLVIIFGIITALTIPILAWCPNKDTITDCSSRGKSQIWDPAQGRYTCGDRQ